MKKITVHFQSHFRPTLSSSALPSIWILGLIAALPLSVLAQILPSPSEQAAQEQQRRLEERERLQREQLQPRPDLRVPLESTHSGATPATQSGRLPLNEAPCFTIKEIKLRQQDAYPASAPAAFNWVLGAMHKDNEGQMDSPIGQCLGAEGVNTIMGRLQNALIAKGYTTTRVVAPAQNLKDGILEYAIVVGRIGAILPHPSNSAFDNSRLSLQGALPLRKGDVLNLRAIEQGLENLKRCPTCEADIQIKPSAEPNSGPGLSDLVVQYRQAFPFRVNLGLDDSGSSGTGKYLSATTVSYDNALGLNDLFYATINKEIGGFISQRNDGKDPGARGISTYNMHYSVPYGNWLLGLNASKNNYHQTVLGAFTQYVYTGESKGQDLELSRLLYRDANIKSYIRLKGWAKQSRNFIDGTEIEVQRRRTAGWEASIDYKHNLGSAKLDGALTWRQGTGALQALNAPEEAFGEGASRPKIINATLSLSSPFQIGALKVKLSSNWRGQWNRTPLIPQDRFSLGGRGTVRGYDGRMVLATERGWLTRNELSTELFGSDQELYLAYDYGRVGGDSAQWMVTQSLQSGAIGLKGQAPQSWGWAKGLNYDVFIGWPHQKHEDFTTAKKAYGFNLNWSF